MLTDDELRYGYWGEKWNELPHPITEVSQYNGGEVLSVSCTQLSATIYQQHQKRIMSEWCDTLPHLDRVKTLCFMTRVNQRLFDAATLMPNLEALYVKWGGIKSIASLAKCHRLRVLSLGSNPAMQDVGWLGDLTELHVLQLENIPKAYRLEFLERLENLEALGIDGSMWTKQKVESLEPLRHLQNLKWLSLLGTKVQKGGLMPLLDIKSLVHVQTALWYTAQEFASLRDGLPLLASGTPLAEETIRDYAKK